MKKADAPMRLSTKEEVEEPAVQPAFETFDYQSFLTWDEWSEKIASSGTLQPPWFRQTGLDDGELLLFSPVPEVVPEGVSPATHNASRWDDPGAQIAKVSGPTKKLIGAVLGAREPAARERAALDLVAYCLVELPADARAKRSFVVGGAEVIHKGDPLPVPNDLVTLQLPNGLKAAEVIPTYVREFLPDRLRKMVHTAALCMAVPEVEFVILRGQEKNGEAPAKLRDRGAREVRDDPNSSEGSSGSGDKT